MTKEVQGIISFLKLSSDRSDSFIEKSKQTLTKEERQEFDQDVQEFTEQYNRFVELLVEKFNLDVSDFSTL